MKNINNSTQSQTPSADRIKTILVKEISNIMHLRGNVKRVAKPEKSDTEGIFKNSILMKSVYESEDKTIKMISSTYLDSGLIGIYEKRLGVDEIDLSTAIRINPINIMSLITQIFIGHDNPIKKVNIKDLIITRKRDSENNILFISITSNYASLDIYMSNNDFEELIEISNDIIELVFKNQTPSSDCQVIT